jgi:hypothetical protein
LKVDACTIRRPAHKKVTGGDRSIQAVTEAYRQKKRLQIAIRRAEKGGPANQKCGKKSIFADITFTNLQL